MIDLRRVRIAAGITQAELGDRLGMSPAHGQRAVSQMETREDWLLSRLAAYVRAAGGTAALIVIVNGEVIQFNLT